MNNMLKIVRPVAVIKRAAQIGNGQFDVWDEGLSCTMDTKVGEIYQWIKTRTGFSGPHCAEVRLLFTEVCEDD